MLERLDAWLRERKDDSDHRSAELREAGRSDEAILERIHGNVFGIFASVLQAAQKNVDGEDGQRAFFERSLANIPTSWRVALDAAIAKDDAIEIAKEEAKLSALKEIEDAYGKFAGEAR